MVRSVTIKAPVGHLDLAPTFCDVAGIERPKQMEGNPLPRSDEEALGREFVLTEWDSEHGPIDMHLKSIYRHDGWLCTSYEKSSLYDGTGASCTISIRILSKERILVQEKQVQQELLYTMRASLPRARSHVWRGKPQFKLSSKSIWLKYLTFIVLDSS